ncbi:MAG: LLM class flavin-dependent oxidoreductase [Conexivisphaerales archaeon]
MKIGIAVENFTSPGKTLDVNSIIEYCVKADELGFESVWTWDHLLLGSKNVFPVLDSLTLLSYIASRTKRVKLGTLYISALRDPLVSSKILSTLDFISNERMIVAVASGWYKREFDAVGVNYEKRGSAMIEGLGLMNKLLYEGDVSYSDGRRAYSHVTISPMPKHHIPLLMGGYVDAVLKRVARYSDGWLSYYYGPTDFKESADKIGSFAMEYGRNPVSFMNTNMVPIYVDYDVKKAREKVEDFTSTYMDLPAWSKCSVESGIWGSPQAIIKKLREYEKVNVKRMVLIPAFYEANQLDVIAGKIISEFG